MVLKREEVEIANCWNVEAIYSDIEAWKKGYTTQFPEGKRPRWPELKAYQGTIDSPERLKEFLVKYLDVQRLIEKMYTYAHLRHDEDTANDAHKTAYQQILGIFHDFSEELSWFEPELLLLPQEIIKTIMNSPLLEEYHFFLEKIVRLKEHTLSPECESILALSGQSLATSSKAFSAINDADFVFGKVKNKEGKEVELTHSSYSVYVREQDRVLRENAFQSYHKKYQKYENTLAELLQGQANAHFFQAKARGYLSCLDAALYPKNIDTRVYHALIEAVNDQLDALHKYYALRKQALGLESLHLYDVYVPLTKEFDMKVPYEKAEADVIASVAPLGEEYQEILRQGLQKERWVDRYENKNKRSGAYSSGCYDSMPYILMNYNESIRDLFTLAHEAGHSMHSYYSKKTQKYHDARYPIFVAEVASTFNEELLTRYLLDQTESRVERIFLINQKIEDIRATLFRQTMFAEFELLIHQFVEKNIPLTPRLLNEEYRKLNEKYFGSGVVIDKEIDSEWSRIPHFYYNFYVYQYATGISAALSLADRVMDGGAKEREDYLGFLKGGFSRYPIDLLKGAGVDLTTPEPVIQAIGKFRSLVEELELLLNSEDLAVLP